MSEAHQNGPTRSLDTLRSRPPEELRAIGKMQAKAAGSSIRDFFDANKSSLTALVQGHMTPERLLGVALNAIRQTPKLQQCTVASLFGAIVQCGVMRLEPNTFDGHCYLMPRKKTVPIKDEHGNIVKQNGRWLTQDIHEVNVQIGYKGRIELAYRSPKVKSLFTSIIHANDKYKIIEGTERRIEHEPRLDGDRGAAIAYYAVAELTTDGRPLFDWMSVHDIERVRDNFSEGYARADENRKSAQTVLETSTDAREQRRARLDLEKAEDNPWIRDFDQMARKTVLNRLDPYLPSTPESSLARALDLRDSTLRSQDLGGVIDGTAMAYDDDDEDNVDAGQQQIEHTVTVGAPKQPATVTIDPREELKRQVAEELAQQAAKADAEEKQKAAKKGGGAKKVQAEPEPEKSPAEDKVHLRAEALLAELAAFTGPAQASEYYALLDRATTKLIVRDVTDRADGLGTKVLDAIADARGRIGPPQQQEGPPPETEWMPGDP